MTATHKGPALTGKHANLFEVRQSGDRVVWGGVMQRPRNNK